MDQAGLKDVGRVAGDVQKPIIEPAPVEPVEEEPHSTQIEEKKEEPESDIESMPATQATSGFRRNLQMKSSKDPMSQQLTKAYKS